MEKITQLDGYVLTETEDIDFTALAAAVKSLNVAPAPDIKGFAGEYRWLSNFWPAKVMFEGTLFLTTEHAYVFSKLMDEEKQVLKEDMLPFISLTAGAVKRYGRNVDIRKNFDDIKIAVMTEITAAKYSDSNPDLVEKLLATGNAYIEETNTWGDTFWGVNLEGVGLNNLGKIIMARRGELNA